VTVEAHPGRRSPASTAMKLSVVLSTQPARFEAVAFKGDLESNLAAIAGMGYDGVELAVRDPRLLDGDELFRTVARFGLEIPAIGTGQAWGEEGLSYTDPDPAVRTAAVHRTKAHIPLAARTGAVIIVGLLRGVVRPGIEPQQAMTWLVEALRDCCSAARASDVRIALEPINRYETTLVNNAAQGLELLEQVGAENLGLLLDTFHMNIEDAVIEESIAMCSDRIFHFHVADSNRWYPGAGHIDFKSVLEALYQIGYRGYVSGEFMPVPDAESAARAAIALLRSVEEVLGRSLNSR
jgi:sugar phosphate isomerase/epimerase